MSGYYTLILLLIVGLCGSCIQSEKSNVTTEEISAPIESRETVLKTFPAVIYRSTDAGKTWMSYANGVPQEATVSSFLEIDNITYATTDTYGIYAIKQGETKWLRIDADLPENVEINAMTAISNVFMTGTHKHGILISRNGGLNWEQSFNSLSHTPIRCLFSYETIVLAGADDGIYKSMDQGKTWQQVYRGVQTNGFAVLGNKIYAAVMNGALMTLDDGVNWKYIYKPHTLHDISSDGINVYAMTLGGGLLKSKNDGLTWENVNGGLGETRWYTFEVKNIDDQLFAAQWHGIYSSDKSGRKWEKLKNGLPDSTAFSTMEATATGLIAGIGLRKNKRWN